MTNHRITVLLGAVCLLMGWIAGGSKQVVKAQETTGGQFAGELLEGSEWRMHSPGTTVHTWLYNAKTGKVYKVFSTCGEDSEGCLLAVPVLSADRLSEFLPNPGITPSEPGG